MTLSRVGHLPAASEARRLPSGEEESSGSIKLWSGALACFFFFFFQEEEVEREKQGSFFFDEVEQKRVERVFCCFRRAASKQALHLSPCLIARGCPPATVTADRGHEARRTGELLWIEEGDRKHSMASIGFAFFFFSLSLFYSPSFRTCADSACSASAAVVDRRRPSSMARDESLSRWRHFGGGRREKGEASSVFFVSAVADKRE